MVILRRIVPAALLAALVVSCSCFDFSTNTLKLRTDCLGGDPADSELEFVIAPDVGYVNDALQQLPQQLPLHCETSASDDSLSCPAIGLGTDPSGNTALLCDVKMQVAGVVGSPADDTFFLCTAERAFGDTGIFPMSCIYIDLQQHAKAGPGGKTECNGIAVIEQQASATDAAAGQAGG